MVARSCLAIPRDGPPGFLSAFDLLSFAQVDAPSCLESRSPGGALAYLPLCQVLNHAAC